MVHFFAPACDHIEVFGQDLGLLTYTIGDPLTSLQLPQWNVVPSGCQPSDVEIVLDPNTNHQWGWIDSTDLTYKVESGDANLADTMYDVIVRYQLVADPTVSSTAMLMVEFLAAPACDPQTITVANPQLSFDYVLGTGASTFDLS